MKLMNPTTPIAKVVQIFFSIPNSFSIGTVQQQMFRWRSNSTSINPTSKVSAIGQAILMSSLKLSLCFILL